MFKLINRHVTVERENYTVIPCLSSFVIWEEPHIQHFPASAKLQTLENIKDPDLKVRILRVRVEITCSQHRRRGLIHEDRGERASPGRLMIQYSLPPVKLLFFSR